jgi:hypothetical protein
MILRSKLIERAKIDQDIFNICKEIYNILKIEGVYSDEWFLHGYSLDIPEWKYYKLSKETFTKSDFRIKEGKRFELGSTHRTIISMNLDESENLSEFMNNREIKAKKLAGPKIVQFEKEQQKKQKDKEDKERRQLEILKAKYENTI